MRRLQVYITVWYDVWVGRRSGSITGSESDLFQAWSFIRLAHTCSNSILYVCDVSDGISTVVILFKKLFPSDFLHCLCVCFGVSDITEFATLHILSIILQRDINTQKLVTWLKCISLFLISRHLNSHFILHAYISFSVLTEAEDGGGCTEGSAEVQKRQFLQLHPHIIIWWLYVMKGKNISCDISGAANNRDDNKEKVS